VERGLWLEREAGMTRKELRESLFARMRAMRGTSRRQKAAKWGDLVTPHPTGYENATATNIHMIEIPSHMHAKHISTVRNQITEAQW